VKKIFLFILVFVIGLYCVSFNTVYAYTDTVEEYQVNAPDWSNDEFINYYKEHKVQENGINSKVYEIVFKTYRMIEKDEKK